MAKDYSNLNKKLVIKSFWQVIRKFKISFFIVIITTSLAAALDVYVPFQYLKLWNILSVNNFSVVSLARSVILLILILNLSRWIFRRIFGFYLAYFEANVIAGLREQSFSYLIGHSRSFFSDNFSGSLTQKINRYARAFEKLTDRMSVDAIPLLIRGVGTIIAIYTLFPKYAFILGIFAVVFLVTTFFYIRYKLKYDLLSAEADSKTTGAIADSISNHSSIQFFTGHNHEKKIVGEVVQNQRKTTTINWYLWEGLNAINSFYSIAVEFIIFWMVIGDWKLGLIALPVIVLLQSYLLRLIENLWSFGGIVRTFYESFADAQEMSIILSTPYEIKDDHKNILQNTKGEVTFENVTYIYDKNNTKVFDNFSLTIPAGQKIAIVGSSGAGKSTFVNLLMRLFNLNSGRILIDSTDISKISQKNLREEISFVPQDPSLFHRSLLENIRYGRKNATDKEVKEAASLAH